MTIQIKGIGVVGGFGCGVADLTTALEKGESIPNTMAIDAVSGSMEVPVLTADTSRLSDYLPARRLRRIGHYTRMALLGCFLALEDAGGVDGVSDRMGIIVATGYGSTCNRFDFQDLSVGDHEVCYSPTQFSNSVHNAAAAYVSVFLKAMGPNLSINHFDLSIASAFLTASQWIREGRVDSVLVGGVDEISKVMACYWHDLEKGKYRPTEPRSWQHAIIGEGSVFFLLTKNGQETSFGEYGYLRGAGMGNYQTHAVESTDATLLFLGADGYGSHDSRYSEYIPGNIPVASYAHLYGGLPVGMGFDIAIAAISLKTGRSFASSDCAFDSGCGSRVAAPARLTRHQEIHCLKLSDSHHYGVVSISDIGI